MKLITKRSVAMIIIILVIGMLGLFARYFGSMEWLVENETRMREFVIDFPIQSWFLGLCLYIAFSMIPGAVGKSVVCGWLFGFWSALLLVDLGLTTAAMLMFLGARFVFRDAVHRKFGRVISRLNAKLDKEGVFYLLALRMAHVPFTIVNYGAATTSIRTFTFAWTTALGMLPNSMVFVFVGTRIPTLRQISEKGLYQLLDPLLFAVLAATVVLPFSIRWVVRRFKRRRDAANAEVDMDPLESQVT